MKKKDVEIVDFYYQTITGKQANVQVLGSRLLRIKMSLSNKKVNPYSAHPYKAYILVNDVKEFIREDYKNTILAKRGEISWQEYIRRKDKLVGEDLI